MVNIKAFSGVRYSSKWLSRYVCPPYDVISKNQARALLKNSKDNFIKMEAPMLVSAKDAYKLSKKFFDGLLSRGVVQMDDEPSLYIYAQSFSIGKKKYERKGIICAVELQNSVYGGIIPHEKTLSSPKKDRARLLKSVKANTSPVFFISQFDDLIKRIIANISLKEKPVHQAQTGSSEAVPQSGIISHKLWRIKEPALVRALSESFRPKKLYIADGHHRYNVARRYYKKYPSSASKHILGFIADINDKNLVILPTHRIVKSAAVGNISELIKTKKISEISLTEYAAISAQLPQPFKIALKGITTAYKALSTKKEGSQNNDTSFTLRNIAPSIVKTLILENVKPSDIFYTSSEQEAVSMTKSAKNCAIILPPTPVAALIKISNNREYMPPKSTYFFPKIFAGFVVYSHKYENQKCLK